jgi:DNA helicase HerA-like ATPase
VAKTLKLAADLSLPLDTVTQTIAILAKRRAGKSYAMRRLVEQLYQAGQQVVLVDPKGDQWGIRSSADGKSAGLPLMILGGEHGDLKTLEPGSGAIVAKMLVEERVSAVLDLSVFRKSELAHFMGGAGPTEGFLEALYRLKAREEFRTPVMLVIDEADAIAPQKPAGERARMLGAAEDIVRRGGQRGIGCVVVTQRSAVLNKNILTQAQIMMALRTIAPQDLAAMNAWIDVHGTSSRSAPSWSRCHRCRPATPGCGRLAGRPARASSNACTSFRSRRSTPARHPNQARSRSNRRRRPTSTSTR